MTWSRWYSMQGLPSITNEQLTQLNTPITEQDILKTIQQLTNNKAPGPDGLPMEFYKIMKDSIADDFTKLYTHVWEGGHYFPTGLKENVKVLPKPGKDNTKPESYHSISLINVDTKIFSKIVADRMAVILLDVISPSQPGFVKG